MIIAFWIVAGLAAIVLFVAGAVKLVRPIAALKAAGMGWVDDYSSTVVKLIALAEVMGALGLILPVATGIAPILSPIAGVALAIVMVGAVGVLRRRKESVVGPIVVAVLALAAAGLGLIVVAL